MKRNIQRKGGKLYEWNKMGSTLSLLEHIQWVHSYCLDSVFSKESEHSDCLTSIHPSWTPLWEGHGIWADQSIDWSEKAYLLFADNELYFYVWVSRLRIWERQVFPDCPWDYWWNHPQDLGSWRSDPTLQGKQAPQNSVPWRPNWNSHHEIAPFTFLGENKNKHHLLNAHHICARHWCVSAVLHASFGPLPGEIGWGFPAPEWGLWFQCITDQHSFWDKLHAGLWLSKRNTIQYNRVFSRSCMCVV